MPELDISIAGVRATVVRAGRTAAETPGSAQLIDNELYLDKLLHPAAASSYQKVVAGRPRGVDAFLTAQKRREERGHRGRADPSGIWRVVDSESWRKDR